jgi:hypothetical protein
MLISYKRGQGSVILRVKILNSSVSTGAGLTGLTNASAGLIISTIADNEATATAYTVAGSNVETITTLGTYAAPTAGKCRFKEVDATNHPGVYEIQLADARFAVASAKSLLVSISGATNAAQCDAVIPLRDLDPYDAVRAGLSALPNAAAGANGGLPTGNASGHVTLADGSLTAAKIAAAALEAAKFAADALTAISGAVLATPANKLATDGTGRVTVGTNADKTGYALTAGEHTALVAAIEAEIADDATGQAVKQAIVDKLIENLPSLDDLTLAAIADAVCDELLSGHAIAGSVGAALASAKAAADYRGDFVYLDPDNGAAGTTVGVNGTFANPCNSFADAAAIATARGRKQIRFRAGASLSAPLAQSYTGFLIDLNGGGLTLNPSTSFASTTFFNGGQRGLGGLSADLLNGFNYVEIDAGIALERLRLPAVRLMSYAYLRDCDLTGNVTSIATNGVDPNILVGCYNARQSGNVVFDLAGGASFKLHYWFGDLTVSNLAAGQTFEVYGYGNLTIDASCTGGTIRHTSHVEIAVDNAAVTKVLVSDATATDAIAAKLPDTLSLDNINAQADAAIETYHLDHLLAADYDPANKPGVATALLNELVENDLDLGVSRFTANALEQAPAGGGGGGNVTVEAFTAGALAQLNGVDVTVQSPVNSTGTITITRGDSYLVEDDRAIRFTDTGGTWPDLSTATSIVIRAKRNHGAEYIVGSGVLVTPGANQVIDLQIEGADTADLSPGRWGFAVTAIYADADEWTFLRGPLQLDDNYKQAAA